jgi:hypothetical protein
MEKVLNIFTLGKEKYDYEHEWVYNKPTKATFTYPIIVEQDRVCECCGRHERVEIQGDLKKYDVNKYNKLTFVDSE